MTTRILGRRGRLIISALILFAVTAACGAGAPEESAAESALDNTPADVLEEPPAPPAQAVPIAQALLGCWDGPNAFFECFYEGGGYVYSQGTPQPGVFRMTSDNQVEIITASGQVTTWTIVVDELTLHLSGANDRTLMYVRRPADLPPNDQLVGCWQRTTGGATECYSADRTWATRRGAAAGTTSTTGTWRMLSSGWLELIIGGESRNYGVVWHSPDRLTFIASDSREIFVRVED